MCIKLLKLPVMSEAVHSLKDDVLCKQEVKCPRFFDPFFDQNVLFQSTIFFSSFKYGRSRVVCVLSFSSNHPFFLKRNLCCLINLRPERP